MAFDLKSNKCAQLGAPCLFQHFVSMGLYEAHQAAKKGYTPATWVVPHICHNSSNYLCIRESGLVRIEAWAHTELAMLLKYIKTPVLSVPLGFLSHLKQSDASTVTGRVLAAIFWWHSWITETDTGFHCFKLSTSNSMKISGPRRVRVLVVSS